MKKLLFLFLLLTLLIPFHALARENVDYWYVKNFTSDIKINSDSSLTIDEHIVADCGQCVDKHGIFRMLPTTYSPESGKNVNLHIKLISITDFNNKPYKYETSTDYLNHTITWKIGDPDIIIQGINNYEIKYSVANGIRTNNKDFDEFYWNLNGNFWDIETDQFTANITFPNGANQSNITTNLYSGTFGDQKNNLANLKWLDNQTLQVNSAKTLDIGEGVTLSATFPKNIVTPYAPSFWEKYGSYLYFLIPILIFILCFLLWNKYGKDPKINPTIIAEFEIPNNLSPMSLGLAFTDGKMQHNFITASIINLAVKKIIKIEEIPKKGFFSSVNYKLTQINSEIKDLSEDEKQLLLDLFVGKKEILLSDLKDEFYQNIPGLSSIIMKKLVKDKLLYPYSRLMQIVFVVVGIFFFFASFFALILSSTLALSIFLAAIIILIFSFLMPARPLEGAKFYRQILGFKLYMNTAEKYRERFFEKENIFDKLLPYAIMFGMTEFWIKKMKQIYGEKYFTTYHPYWLIGSIGQFNIDNFTSTINSMSSNMNSTISSSPSNSGTGGGGFSGGGGGGGGGGGW